MAIPNDNYKTADYFGSLYRKHNVKGFISFDLCKLGFYHKLPVDYQFIS